MSGHRDEGLYRVGDVEQCSEEVESEWVIAWRGLDLQGSQDSLY